jgi:hypothetical protein
MFLKIGRFLQSPANWCGVGLASTALILSSLGLMQWGAPALAALGYVAGFGVGGLWLGFPRLSVNPWDELEFEDAGDARTSMLNALEAVRQLVDYNPEGRLPASLQAKVLAVSNWLRCGAMERSKGQLSLEESHAHIAALPARRTQNLFVDSAKICHHAGVGQRPHGAGHL